MLGDGWKTQEEYIAAEKSNMVNPQAYDVEGTYDYEGGANSFSGTFYIDDNKKVVGEIIDPNSVCPRNTVKGQIDTVDDLLVLDFVKMPPNPWLAEVRYTLVKRSSEIAGEYDGGWVFEEEALTMDARAVQTDTTNKAKLTLRLVN